jgi:S-adenosylmethionine decarboxylase
MGRRIKLHNFNNLSKNLNISFYDINYVTNEDKFSCVKYMHSMYNTANLVKTLKMVTKKINASILNISKQDYEPVGSSVNFLITEEPVKEELVDHTCNLGHLDKSHIAIHTYPEYSKKTNISTIRLDFSISTCGLISPLKAINYLLEKFSKNNCADIIQIDYFVRGFTRTSKNKKIFIDHKPAPIYKFINKKFLSNYKIFNKNYDEDNL